MSPFSFWTGIALASVALINSVRVYLSLISIPYMKFDVANDDDKHIGDRISVNGDAIDGDKDNVVPRAAISDDGLLKGNGDNNGNGEGHHIAVASYVRWLYDNYNLGGPFLVLRLFIRACTCICQCCRRCNCTAVLPQLSSHGSVGTSGVRLTGHIDHTRRWSYCCCKSVSYSSLRAASLIFTAIAAATLAYNIMTYRDSEAKMHDFGCKFI
jgi:hypothetical protein